MTEQDLMEIMVHGPRCPNWEEPKSVHQWQALELVQRESENVREGACPACGQVVWVQIDHGMIDLGL